MNAYQPMASNGRQSNFHDLSFVLLFSLWLLSLVVLYVVRAIVEESILRPFVALLFSAFISGFILLFFMFVFNWLLVFSWINTFVINTILILSIAVNIAFMRMDPVYNTPEQRAYERLQEKMQQRVREETKAFEKMRAERREQEAKEFPFPWEQDAK